MAFTGDKRPSRQREKSPGRGDQSDDDSTSSADTATSPDMASGSQPATTPDSGSSPASAQSRFGFLSALTNRWSNQPVITPQVEEELLSMNVETALYPSGSPDAFSPAAYKNLQANATGLLLKMQTAYRQRTTALQDMQAERSAEKEETEEARLRVDHLKMQLEHMASQAVEQEHAMKQLMDELKAERKARRGEQLAREKILAEGSVVSEDLGVDEEERKKWRKSGSTIKSDVSFDTDEESAESESVFSRSRSPTLTTSGTEILDAPSPQGANTPTLSLPPKPKFGKEMSTFQKLMKGISGDSTNDDGRSGACKSCKGQDSTRAWDTVSLLRDENKDLKQRMAQLEVAVEGALDLVNGIGVRP